MEESVFAEMWRRSRNDAGKSQEYMASALGVSKKTIQNWESGYSCPSQATGFRWFEALGLNPMPYYLDLLYNKNGVDPGSDEEIRGRLIDIINGMPSDALRKLLYCFSGEHGSSPLAVLELVTAHLQAPMSARLSVAEIVRLNYELAMATGTLSQPDGIQPNTSLLNAAYTKGKDAVKHGEAAYTVILEELQMH